MAIHYLANYNGRAYWLKYPVHLVWKWVRVNIGSNESERAGNYYGMGPSDCVWFVPGTVEI